MSEKPPIDLNFGAATTFGDVPASIRGCAKNAELHHAAATFGLNMHLLQIAADFPRLLFEYSTNGILYWAFAMDHVLKGQNRPPTAEELVEIHGVSEELAKGVEKIPRDKAYGKINQLVSGSGHARIGIEFLHSSQIISAWTHFEVLAGDLWVACLNAVPRLGFAALNAEIKPEDDLEEQERKKRIKYSIPLRLLEKYNYDLRNRMGTVLQRKWNFARRNESHEAYLRAFGKAWSSEIAAIFTDQKLGWLTALRNVIVHNAGVADSEFRDLVLDHPTLKLVKSDEKINLEGTMVSELCANALNQGIALTRFVDSRLAESKSG
jgi:hypothetical protein